MVTARERGLSGTPAAGVNMLRQLPLEPAPPSVPPFCLTASGWSWCPATRETASHAPSPVTVGGGFGVTRPGRSQQGL
jgi:hypothetical protein